MTHGMSTFAALDTAFVLQAFMQLLAIPEENNYLFDLLSQGRFEIASLCGYASYAEHMLDSCCLAGSPEAVTTFLKDLKDTLQPQVMPRRHFGNTKREDTPS